MRSNIIQWFLCLIFYASCTSEQVVPATRVKVSYKVVTESGLWYGSYVDKNGNEVSLIEEPYQPSEWTHTFYSDDLPALLNIEAMSEFYNDSTVADKPDITAMIFIDGELQVSQTNSPDDGKTNADYPDEVLF